MAERRRRRSKKVEEPEVSEGAKLTDSMKVQEVIFLIDKEVMRRPDAYPSFHRGLSKDGRRSYMSGVFKVAADKTRHHPAELTAAWDRRFNQPPAPEPKPAPVRKKKRRRPKRPD